jgi:hypothetical protein
MLKLQGRDKKGLAMEWLNRHKLASDYKPSMEAP